MTPDEIIKLCRYIKAACPAQAMDEFTPDVWADILPVSYTLDECRAAVIAIKQRQPYVDVSDVITEVKRARRADEDRQGIRALLDPAAYRRKIAEADQRTAELISARAGRTLAIAAAPQGSASPAPAGRVIMDPQAVATRQAARSRAAREARTPADSPPAAAPSTEE